MGKTKRQRNKVSKYIKAPVVGRCPYCHINVKSLEAHTKAKHKGQKLVRR